MLLLPSCKVIEIIFNGVIIPVTNPRSVVVLVSTSTVLLRFKCFQLASFSSLLLIINKYSASIVIIANLYPHIAVIS